MTPNFLTGLALANPTADPVYLILESDDRPEGPFATIRVGSTGMAQGPILRRFFDGSVTIDAGGRILTGHPVRVDAQKGFWARLSKHLS
ncbi:hypothetical protein JJJ17_11985 [Paracoccus caeni]|uniref:Uncharacterized protein n=1 Tax=Paracoccus caeni TaxID=657651 RepID=A0A934VZ38_9RHOB|nr:hypothetical protein [Paracoccus caeni]MBK4216647.1 hypothetical protein [Paracoccus caeni]